MGMRGLLSLLLPAICIAACASPAGTDCDICIYGGTSAGVIAARSAAQQGKNVILIEPSSHIGGLTTGGLGQTDMGKRQKLCGLAKDFYDDVGKYYGTVSKLVFEPHAASEIFASYLDSPKIRICKDTGLRKAVVRGRKIKSIRIAPLDDKGCFAGREKTIRAKVFIDCSYEGDLMASAGVGYTTGRESSETYGEPWNGFHFAWYHQFPDGVDPYVVPGEPSSGLLWGISDAAESPEGSADSLVQAYNLRVCLTDSTDNRIPFTKPDGYDAGRYELLARLMAAQPEDARYFIWSPMPGRKTDINNYGGFSTDMIGCNSGYIEGSYSRRKEILDAHGEYIKGLFWFILTDPRVPQALSREVSRWGYPKDEYTENGHWTPQLYVREGRRMLGDYVVTQADCEGRIRVEDGIAEAAYMMDSHNCQRIVVERNGVKMVKNEGDVEIKIPGPYPVSYRAIVPKREECTNLLVPVCVSASHIAFGSIRMEPVFMTLGEVAARAACIAADEACSVQDIDYRRVRCLF